MPKSGPIVAHANLPDMASCIMLNEPWPSGPNGKKELTMESVSGLLYTCTESKERKETKQRKERKESKKRKKRNYKKKGKERNERIQAAAASI